MDYSVLLRHIGLGERESKVYLELVSSGELSVSELSKQTNIHRPALYQLLPKLVSRNFVSAVKRGKREKYVAESPEKLLKLYETEQQLIRESFGSLQAEYEANKHTKPTLKAYDGSLGSEAIFDDIVATLPKGGLYYRYSAKTNPSHEKFKNTRYYQERDVKNIERMVITSSSKANRKQKKLHRDVKAIPAEFDLFDDNVSLLIYGNKTAYIDYNTNTSFLIESDTITKFQEKLFKLLWKKLGRN